MFELQLEVPLKAVTVLVTKWSWGWYCQRCDADQATLELCLRHDNSVSSVLVLHRVLHLLPLQSSLP